MSLGRGSQAEGWLPGSCTEPMFGVPSLWAPRSILLPKQGVPVSGQAVLLGHLGVQLFLGEGSLKPEGCPTVDAA